MAISINSNTGNISAGGDNTDGDLLLSQAHSLHGRPGGDQNDPHLPGENDTGCGTRPQPGGEKGVYASSVPAGIRVPAPCNYRRR